MREFLMELHVSFNYINLERAPQKLHSSTSHLGSHTSKPKSQKYIEENKYYTTREHCLCNFKAAEFHEFK